jgi:hypothetical protein
MNSESPALQNSASQNPSRPVDHHAIRRNLAYLWDPKNPNRPTRFRTRAILKTLRYVGVFIFWRLLRTLRYALVGSLVAAAAGTLLGPLTGGVSVLLAPPDIISGAGVGVMWALIRFRWRKFANTVREGKEEGADPRGDERNDAERATEDERRRKGVEGSKMGRQFDPLT